ncbi:MAG: hypothetical protein ABFC80_03795 [Coriobacteriales bacterium]
MNEDFERIVELTPAYDGRPPSKGGRAEWRAEGMEPYDSDYGIQGVTLRMVLKGEKGAVHFMAHTDWYPPHVQQELARKGESRYLSPLLEFKPMGAEVDYHSPRPMYEGQEPFIESCEYLDGRPCYYGGSSLRAQEWVTILLKEGSDGVWKALEDEYRRLFGSDERAE